MSHDLSDADDQPEAERSDVGGICGRIPGTIPAPPYPDGPSGEIVENSPEFAGAPRRACPVCGALLTGGKTSACSDRCRAARSRRTRTARQAAKDTGVSKMVAVMLAHAADCAKWGAPERQGVWTPAASCSCGVTAEDLQ